MVRTRIHHLVEESAGRRPTSPAVTSKDVTLTYAELGELAESVARGLRALGLERGDRVGVFLDKRVETVAAVLGTSAADGVFVPVNPLLRPRQTAYVLGHCDVRVLVTSRERLSGMVDELAGLPALEHVVLVGSTAPVEPVPGAASVTSWQQLVDSAAHAAPVPVSAGVDTDVAAIFYTSGSTGSPKGVVLSHRNLLVGAESVASYLGNDEEDVVLSALPLSFDAGFSQLTTAFSVGAHVVLLNYLMAKDVVRLCAEHRVTGLTAVPPLWIQLVEQEWPPEASRHLRYFANTGGRMPRATLTRLREIFPAARPYLMYGLTEAFRSTYLDPAEVDRRPDSIGKAIPNAEVLVVRPDGSLCAPGEEGELVHRGPLVALGYWNDDEKTAARFKPAPQKPSGVRTEELAVWSGDAVVRDEEGFLYFVGRSDDMIKTSGYRVSPSEVEEAAYDTGLVRDAVALGVADDRLGQHIVLVVAVQEDGFDPATLVAAMRRSVPAYMVPQRVQVMAEVPRSPNGKFDRNLLKEQLRA